MVTIVLIVFIVLEVLNVFLLYYFPGSSLGNAVGVFKAYEKVQKDPEISAFVKYLIRWVAGTKLIFIGLLLIILVFADASVKTWSMGVLVVTVATYFWKLHPLITAMDQHQQITPRGYSRTLGIMIAIFIGMFLLALLIQ